MKRLLALGLLLLLVLGVLFAWQLPAILKAVPSRYVARLPEPLQALGEREHVAQLPTAVPQLDSATLLAANVDAKPAAPPATPTAIATVTATTQPAGPAESLPPPTETPPPSPSATSQPVPASARITGIQHHFQDWNNCGPATLAMGLSYFGLGVGQVETATFLKPNPEDRNVSPEEMADYVRQETDLDALVRVNGNLDILRRLIAGGYPVIVETGLLPQGEFAWMEWYGHYLLPVAYDDAQEQVWVYDSWFGTSAVPFENASSEGREISYDDLLHDWAQFNWTYMVMYRPEQAGEVAQLIGADMDDTVMWETALTHNQDGLRADGSNAFLWFNLGTVYNALGNYELAAAAFDQARGIGLPWRMLWYQFGPYQAYYERGRYADMITLADVTLQDRPYFEESYYYRGLANAALGNMLSARNDLERAVEFNPRFTPAVEALAELDTE